MSDNIDIKDVDLNDKNLDLFKTKPQDPFKVILDTWREAKGDPELWALKLGIANKILEA